MRRATRSPFVFRDEVVAAGVDHYELIVTEDDLEKLMSGRVSHALMESAFRLLSWKREGDQDWEHYQCSCAGCIRRRTVEVS